YILLPDSHGKTPFDEAIENGLSQPLIKFLTENLVSTTCDPAEDFLQATQGELSLVSSNSYPGLHSSSNKTSVLEEQQSFTPLNLFKQRPQASSSLNEFEAPHQKEPIPYTNRAQSCNPPLPTTFVYPTYDLIDNSLQATQEDLSLVSSSPYHELP